MAKFLTLLSPLATLMLAWQLFMMLLFFVPLWPLWPVLVIGFGVINYKGICFVLSGGAQGKLWHQRANLCEWGLAAFLWWLLFL